jgi:hypothetical protein
MYTQVNEWNVLFAVLCVCGSQIEEIIRNYFLLARVLSFTAATFFSVYNLPRYKSVKTLDYSFIAFIHILLFIRLLTHRETRQQWISFERRAKKGGKNQYQNLFSHSTHRKYIFYFSYEKRNERNGWRVVEFLLLYFFFHSTELWNEWVYIFCFSSILGEIIKHYELWCMKETWIIFIFILTT